MQRFFLTVSIGVFVIALANWVEIIKLCNTFKYQADWEGTENPESHLNAHVSLSI